MIDWLVAALGQLGELAHLEVVAILFAVAYVLLATRQLLWCWPAAMISTTLYVVIYYEVALFSESLLNAYYLLIAVYGWYQWQRGGAGGEPLAIQRWRWTTHLQLIVITALFIPLLGLWTRSLGAAFPFADAATTCFSVLATWLVTRKVLENWLYWVIIDLVGIYLNFARGLYLTSLLFVAYTVLAVYGYWQWTRDYRHATAASKS